LLKTQRFIRSLTKHEKEELERDFNLDVTGKFAIVVMTKAEYEHCSVFINPKSQKKLEDVVG